MVMASGLFQPQWFGVGQIVSLGPCSARPLKLADFAALPVDLGAHPLDFGSEEVKLHGILVQPGAAQPSSSDFPFPEDASGSIPDDFPLFACVHGILEKKGTV
jgi:hypothetical protein